MPDRHCNSLMAVLGDEARRSWDLKAFFVASSRSNYTSSHPTIGLIPFKKDDIKAVLHRVSRSQGNAMLKEQSLIPDNRVFSLKSRNLTSVENRRKVIRFVLANLLSDQPNVPSMDYRCFVLRSC
jgi:hypothetical protein